MLGERMRLPFEEVYRKSLSVQRRFMETGEFCASKRLALYASFRNEVLTDEIFSKAVMENKEVYFPRVVRPSGRSHLAFFRVRGKGELSMGSYKILEPPKAGKEAAPGTFDCAVVPGVAFDTGGVRLGYGKGYYDGFLKDTRCPVMGLAFGFQVLSRSLPDETHDVRVGAIVTESGIIRV